MSSDRGNCFSCRFWHRFDWSELSDLSEEDRSASNGLGECRRYPPRLWGFEDGQGVAYPSTMPEMWCGEYRDAIGEELR